MNIHSVKLHNFLSHKDTAMAFGSTVPYLFIGPNGSGKSSLVKDSVTYGLFGAARARGAGDDLIHNAEKTCRVEVVFDVAGVLYRVVRVRERNKKTELTLHAKINDVFVDKTAATATATQTEIEKILGFNYDMFVVSACLEQDSKTNFSTLTPKQCKDLLMRVLDIDKYALCEGEVRIKINELEGRRDTGKVVIESSSARLAKYVDVESRLGELYAKRTEIETRLAAEHGRVAAERQSLETKIKEAEAVLADNNVKAEGLRSAYRAKESELVGIATTLSMAGGEILKAQQRAQKLTKLGDKCPTCESGISQEHTTALMAEIVEEIAAKEKTKAEANTLYNKVQSELQNIEVAANALRLSELVAEIGKLKNSLVSLVSAGTGAAIEKELSNIGQSIARIETERDLKTEVENEIKTARAELYVIEEELAFYAVLKDAFCRNGIPAMIISNAVDELECSINALLRRLTDTNISVKVATEKNLKSTDELSDTLEIVIKEGVIQRPYAMYSGGEKFRIDMAIRLALSQILARRNSFKLETLIIDEPAFLDSSGLQSFKDTVFSLSSMFKKIFIISHLTELVEDTYNKFNVVKLSRKSGCSLTAVTSA